MGSKSYDSNILTQLHMKRRIDYSTVMLSVSSFVIGTLQKELLDGSVFYTYIHIPISNTHNT